MTNEQRAHDIAMLYVQLLLKVQKSNDNNELVVDPYSKYLEVYPMILEKVNHDFSMK